MSGASTCIAYAGRAYTDGFSALWLVFLWAIGMFALCFIPNLSEKQEFKMHRVSTLVVGLITLIIALRFVSLFYQPKRATLG